MSRYYDADGEPISARDVLDDEELRSYLDDQRNWTGRPIPAGNRVRRDELGYRSTDGGMTWTWEPEGGAA